MPNTKLYQGLAVQKTQHGKLRRALSEAEAPQVKVSSHAGIFWAHPPFEAGKLRVPLQTKWV